MTSGARRRRSGGKVAEARTARLPSKADISEFIASSPSRVGRREIARAFGIKGGDRIALKALLREMADEGMIGGNRRNISSGGPLPPVGPADVVAADDEGDLWVAPLAADPPMQIRLLGLSGKQLPASLNVGDRVLTRFVPLGDGRAETADGQTAQYEARLIRRIPKREKRLLGILSSAGKRALHVRPVSRGGLDDIPLDPDDAREASAGDLVTVALLPGRAPRARLVEVHGRADGPGTVSLIALAEHEIPHEFPPAVLKEAEAAEPPSPGTHVDLTGLDLITIDPEDARDHDDAVLARPDPAKGNPGGWLLTVAIADVAHYVRPGTALDREARLRGNSVYFPDRVVPMLPERLSNELCSLKPDVERPALVAHITIDASGEPVGRRFERAMIRSRAKLSYRQAQAAIDGAPDDTTGPLRDTILRPLWAAYDVLARARDKREPLDLDLPERRIILGDDGVPTGVATPPRLAAHRLIEEFMIQANVAAAKALNDKRSPFLRRVHEAPAPEKVDALARYLTALDLRLPRGQVLTPAHFNRLIRMAEGTPHAGAVSDAILRAQSQAHYAPRDQGHFGLSLRAYAHFTSPIRRYADVIAHRALISALDLGTDGLDRETVAALADIGSEISSAERRAMAAERDTSDRLIAHFLADRVGGEFAGRVSGIVRSGLFVELDETGASGFVAAAVLGRTHGDYFRADEASRALIGEASGTGYRAGDPVRVRLVEANPLAGSLEFEMLTAPAAQRRVKLSRPPKRPPRGKKRRRS